MPSPEKPPKILVVDDEEQIRRALKSILSARKYEVVLAGNGEEALDLAIDHSPDLVILDLAMPGLGGLEVCQELRTWSAAPILVLSVRAGEADKIAALDMGADDYLTKPFSAGELLARVRALLRRAPGQPAAQPIIKIGDLEIDLPRRRVLMAGQGACHSDTIARSPERSRMEQGEESLSNPSPTEIDLTRLEFDILAYLAQNADRVVTSKMLLQQVWGPEYGDDTQTLRVHVSNLRKKIEPTPAVPRYILTEPGVGFRLATGG